MRGLEGVGVESPSAIRNRDAQLVLAVAFAVQRAKREVLAVRQVEERSRRGQQGRRLIEVAPEAVKDPVQTGHADGDTVPRIDVVLDNVRREVRMAEAGD